MEKEIKFNENSRADILRVLQEWVEEDKYGHRQLMRKTMWEQAPDQISFGSLANPQNTKILVIKFTVPSKEGRENIGDMFNKFFG